MRGLIASLYKDLRLMLDRTGILTIVLALFTIPVFLYGTRGFSTETVTRPFPVAVRDLDNTLMSRSLISQIAEIELFSEVHRVEEDRPEADILADGNAAVITIPHDFFYAMYTAEDCPVTIVFNDSQPLQASVVRAVFTSVLDIVSADQAAFRAAYRFAYGDPAEAEKAQMYEDASKLIFLDALGRQNIFEEDIALSDTPGVLRRKLTAMLLPMLSMLFAAGAVCALARERAMGIPARLAAHGAPEGAFILAKLLVTLLFIVPVSVLLYLLSGTGKPLLFAALTGAVVLASFAVMTAVVSFVRDESDARRICNLYLLLSLFFGGTLLHTHPVLRRIFLSGSVYPVLHALHADAENATVFGLLLPFVWMTLLALLLSVAGAVYAKRAHGGTNKTYGERNEVSPTAPGVTNLNGVLSRLFALIRFKTLLYAGGLVPLLAGCLCACLAGYTTGKNLGSAVQTVTVAVADGDGSALSEDLTARVEARSGGAVSFVRCSEAEGEVLLVNGDAEGLLRIEAGYADAVSGNKSVSLHYRGTASAYSEQGVREVIAGQVLAQSAVYKAEREAASLTGRALSAEEKQTVGELFEEELRTLPPVYRASGISGAKAADPFSPDAVSFLALFLLLALFTYASFCGRRDAQAVTRRLAVSLTGRILTNGADLCALFLEGALLALCFLAAGRLFSVRLVLTVLLFVCASGTLSFAVARVSGTTGRVDALAPMLTLIVCLLGGCFLDLSVLSDKIADIMMISPAGAALFAARGSNTALLVLVLHSVLFFAIGMRKCYNR